VQNNAWYHIAYVLDATAGTGTLYVNGTPSGTSNYSGSYTIDPSLYVLGRNGDHGATVRYDRYRWWSQALSQTEIAAIIAGGK
jgi:hypothetical protein